MEPEDLQGNPFVMKGKRFEHSLREHVAADRNTGIIPLCCEYEGYPFIKASLDGIDFQCRPWEFKIPSATNFEEVKANYDKSIPVQTYKPQVQHQLLCTGAKEGFLVFGQVDDSNPDNPRVTDYIVVPIAADLSFQKKIVEEARKFENELINGVEPAKDPERDDFYPSSKEDVIKWADAAKMLLPLLDQKQALQEQLETIETQISNVTGPIIEVLDNNKRGSHAGVKVTRVDKKGSVDWPALVRSFKIDLDDEVLLTKFSSKPTTYYKFRKEA